MGSRWKNSNKSCVLKQLSLSRFSWNFACICLLLCAFSPCMNLWRQIFCWRIDRRVFSWSWEQKEKWEQAQLVQFTWVQTRFVIQLVNHSSSCSCLSHRFYRKATERTLGTKVLCTSSYNWYKKPCFFFVMISIQLEVGAGDDDVHWIKYVHTRSLRALRAPTSSWRPFGPLDFVLRALRALRSCDPRQGDMPRLTP